MAANSGCERGATGEGGAKRGWKRRREGEPWIEELEELTGVILDERKNPGSPSDARKIRKAENSEIRKKSTKTLEQDVEAEIRQAGGQAEVSLKEGRDS